MTYQNSIKSQDCHPGRSFFLGKNIEKEWKEKLLCHETSCSQPRCCSHSCGLRTVSLSDHLHALYVHDDHCGHSHHHHALCSHPHPHPRPHHNHQGNLSACLRFRYLSILHGTHHPQILYKPLMNIHLPTNKKLISYFYKKYTNLNETVTLMKLYIWMKSFSFTPSLKSLSIELLLFIYDI